MTASQFADFSLLLVDIVDRLSKVYTVETDQVVLIALVSEAQRVMMALHEGQVQR